VDWLSSLPILVKPISVVSGVACLQVASLNVRPRQPKTQQKRRGPMSDQEVLANQKTILSHQASILENQKTILHNQATIEKNHKALEEILANQKEILANQKAILAAVKK
jgi:hypothetical protein